MDHLQPRGTGCPVWLHFIPECTYSAVIEQVYFHVDVDECVEETHGCSENADCLDTIGSFQCLCRPGFSGDGVNNCTG